MSSVEKCPVDHGSMPSSSSDKCPVDHSTRWSWTNLFGSSKDTSNSHPPAHQPNVTSHHTSILPTEREISSIPRADGAKWVYPSEQQFYSAMARKNHNPQASDMKVIVPIHNAVNERAWAELMKWEDGQGGDKCGGVKLVSFKGKPNERTPKARWKMLLGYSPPFDRHDWVVDRCGTRVRYIIDFYTGRAGSAAGNLSFYLDVRPALDNWEGVRLRTAKFWHRWTDKIRAPSTSSTPTPSPKSSA
ncbi:unnamed protein product [Somion occarium]|uniref:Holocytochrome c-type synthase n=1 Tax=Somion occarium TaxID=3059160 RepID=A0ABP1D8U1_9APHY